MKLAFAKAALAATAIAVAFPAAAQVNSIAIAEPAIAVAASQALQTAYGQIGTANQAARTQLEQVQQQRATLLRQFDTDGNGELSEAEQTAAQANTAVLQQIQGLDQQIQQIQQPITMQRIYAIEQILLQYNASLQQVISQKNLQLILTPSAVIYAVEAADVTTDITAALNTRVPTVTTTVPANWQPQRAAVQMYQEVQEVLIAAQQQAAAQQPAGAAPAAAPAQPVQGR